MSNRQLAQKFVRDQLRIMRDHGGAPKLDAERRREFVAAVERTFASLRSAKSLSRPSAARTSHRALPPR
jgi:hypothetical protein